MRKTDMRKGKPIPVNEGLQMAAQAAKHDLQFAIRILGQRLKGSTSAASQKKAKVPA